MNPFEWMSLVLSHAIVLGIGVAVGVALATVLRGGGFTTPDDDELDDEGRWRP